MQIYPPKIRTDKMVAEFGVHGEYVEKDTDMIPALDRSLAATREGVPAYINVIADPVVNNEIMGLFTAMLYGNIPYNELTKSAKTYITEGGYLRKAMAGPADPSWVTALEIYEKTGKVPESV